jgi:hypothetical protein
VEDNGVVKAFKHETGDYSLDLQVNMPENQKIWSVVETDEPDKVLAINDNGALFRVKNGSATEITDFAGSGRNAKMVYDGFN